MRRARRRRDIERISKSLICATPCSRAPACAHQTPGIHHVEIAHSDDVEILEITLPAEFATEAVAPPDSNPQDCCLSS